jgi:folate-binding protein YgfZ
VDVLDELQRAAGATFTVLDGTPVAADYGDPLGEYRALRRTAGLVARGDLALIRVWGRDPIRMINGLITNDARLLTGERSVYGAMLTPKGRMISDLRVVLTGGAEVPSLLLIVPGIAADAVRQHLGKYVPPLYARCDAVSEIAVLGLVGPQAAATIEAALGVQVSEARDSVATVTHRGETSVVVADPIGPVSGYLMLVPTVVAGDVWRQVDACVSRRGGSPAGISALEALRVEAGSPRFGRDMSADTLPAEVYESTGLMDSAISFTKGCYTGQEVVIRIAHRGHVNRHLRGLLLGEGSTAGPGTLLHDPATGKEVGRLTSVVESPMLRQAIALGYVRREVGPGAELAVESPDGPPAIVTTLPFEHRGPGAAS